MPRGTRPGPLNRVSDSCIFKRFTHIVVEAYAMISSVMAGGKICDVGYDGICISETMRPLSPVHGRARTGQKDWLD